MALHEDVGDRGLQQHHRHDDDEQGARVKPLGQHVRQSARPQAPEFAKPHERSQRGPGGQNAHPSATKR